MPNPIPLAPPLSNVVQFPARPMPLPPVNVLPSAIPKNVVPFPKPSSGIGLPLAVITTALVVNDVVGRAGGYKWRDDLLAKIGNGKGARVGDTPPNGAGQSVGVLYTVRTKREAPYLVYGQQYFLVHDIPSQTGAISGFVKQGDTWYLITGDGPQGLYTDGRQIKEGATPVILSVTRDDGQTDNPPAASRQPTNEGYTPVLPISIGLATPAIAPPISDNGGGSKLPISSLDPSALKNPSLPEPSTSPPTTPKLNPPLNPSKKPGLDKPPQEKPKEEPKLDPYAPKELTILQRLAEIAGMTALINQNTQPEAQQKHSAAGSCNAMKSPPCTKGLEDRIKAPLFDKLEAAQAARSTIATAQGGAIAAIFAKVSSVSDFLQKVWSNQAVDKAMQYITMITTIHNATMLSRSIADTLGSALDSGLQAIGLAIKDKDGNTLGINQVIGKSFENLIKGIIGTPNYTALTETWVKANRIYQTGINLISNMQSILDSTTAVAELTSNRVGTLMNSLRNSGVVRENAYGAQSQNVTKFNAFMTKLENLEQGVSNLASITSNVVSVQQSVNELKTNRQEFENALKDKPAGTGAPENVAEATAKSERRSESVFKINDFSIVRAPEEGT